MAEMIAPPTEIHKAVLDGREVVITKSEDLFRKIKAVSFLTDSLSGILQLKKQEGRFLEKNMKLFVLQKRESHYRNQALRWKLCNIVSDIGYVSSLTFSNLVNVIRKN